MKIGNASQLGGAALALAALLAVPSAGSAQDGGPMDEVTFARDIAPILQESCQRCHRPGGVGPMALETYEQVRPWAPMIREKTQIRDRMGAMPPYYIERGIGIQHYKDDERLTEDQIALIDTWVEQGAPQGNPADMPAPIEWPEAGVWTMGEPDIVVSTQEFTVPAGEPDWWGDMANIPIPLDEDRYVAAVEIREINDIQGGGGGVGGNYIIHHMIWGTRGPDGSRNQGWPVHEIGRNPDLFDPDAGVLLTAGSEIVSESLHLNAAGTDATAHLEIGFHLHPEGYEPKYTRQSQVGLGLGDGLNIDIQPNESGQELHGFLTLRAHTKIVSFEPHLHAPGSRMCLEAIFGNHIETLSCSGYDHNWVKQYTYEDDYAPLLPAGTVLHMVGYMDNTENNPNIPDPRNWQGSGNRSVSNMFIDLGKRVLLSDEEFVAEMAHRREVMGVGPNDHIVGCPLCMANIPVFESDDAGNADADADR